MKQKLSRYWSELKTEFKSALFKTLANTFSGICLIGLVYYLTPKEESKNYFNEISSTFKKYVEAQSNINTTILNHLKTHEASSDSLRSGKQKTLII